jgi:drug/metabolite transporter (DMT)-like permease
LSADRGRERRRAVWALALLSLIWGYNWIAMKVALQYATPIDVAAVRFGLGALALMPAARYMGYGLTVPRAEWRHVGILSAILAGNFFLTLTALDLAGVGRTAVLNYTMPFWTLLLARWWLKERLRPLQWAAVAAALAGLLVLIDLVHLRYWVPSVLAVVSGLFWAVSVVLIKSLQGRVRAHLMTITAWQMALCALLLWVVALATGTPAVDWSWPFLAAIGFSAFLGSAFSWMLFYYALARLPAGLAGLGTLATPVIGVFAAWIHFGERPSMVDATGMLLIVGGLLLLALVPARRSV